MKIDKEMLNALASMPDDALWQKIREIAGSYGINLGTKTPEPRDLERVREMCRGDTKMSMSQAMKLVNEYKRGQKK